MVHSQNGWPAFHTPDAGHFVRFTVAGRGFWAANADVAVVAVEFLRRFDAEVERLVAPGEVLNDWSFADRLVRGSTADVSNHGSATAWDINSDHHPLGVVGTFSAARASKIRAIVRSITDDSGTPVLRWGGDYKGRKDEMHVEINANAARVKQAANKIRNSQEDEMPTAKELWDADQIPVTRTSTADKNPTWAAKAAVGRIFDNSQTINATTKATDTAVKSMVAQLGALNATVASLATALKTGGSLTAAQAQAAAEAGARAALAELGHALDPAQ